MGYGLVVGLNGTGDKLKNSAFTEQSLIAFLERQGVNTRGTELKTKNVAAATVTASLPAFSRTGSRIDVNVSAMGDAMRLGTYAGIQLLRPFIALDKGRIAAEGVRLGVDFSRTWSCYKGGEIHCGTCGTCVERREAFMQAGLTDPTVYVSHAALPPKPV
jgi:hypothetical protein